MDHRLDKAFIRFKTLKVALPSDDGRVITESDTRLKLIDPMLTEVLGWPKLDILTEEHVPPGRLDYLLCDEDGHPCVVVEAKARDVILLREGKRGERLKVGGPAFAQCIQALTDQVAPYCQSKRVALGMLTNGLQWVVFFGNRTDGIAIRDDYGAPFSSLDEVESNFELFYDLFSYDGFRRGMPSSYLLGSQLRGEIRAFDSRRVIDLITTSRVRRSSTNSEYYKGFASLLEDAFRPIHDDPDKLIECFVETRESKDADQRLARLAEDLVQNVGTVHDAEQYHEHVQGHVDQVRPGPAKAKGERAREVEVDPTGILVQLIGERSAGKTTFLRRFYTRTLDRKWREHIAYVHLRFEKIVDVDTSRIGTSLVEDLEARLFGREGPDHNLLMEIYKRDWSKEERRRAPNQDKEQVLSDFALRLEKRIHADPFAHALRLAEFAVQNRQLLPCIVFDDFDHFTPDQIRCLFAAATAIAAHSPSIVTLAMDDITVWRNRSVDIVAKQSPVTFWLPRPKVRKVLENRFEYIKKHLSASKAEATPSTRQLEARVGRSGMKWRPSDPDQVISAIQSVFIWDREDVVGWIGQLANHDIRDVLEISKNLLCSSVIAIEDHLGATVTGASPSKEKVLRALISPDYICFRPDKSMIVANVFAFEEQELFALLLPMRILAVLRAAMIRDSSASAEIRGFVAVRRLQDAFGRLGVTRSTTLRCLELLRERGLLQPYDPSRSCAEDSNASVKINPRGELHLEWATNEPVYVSMMAETDQIFDQPTWRRISDSRYSGGILVDGEALGRASAAIARTYVTYLLANAQPVVDESFEARAMGEVEALLRQSASTPQPKLAAGRRPPRDAG